MATQPTRTKAPVRRSKASPTERIDQPYETDPTALLAQSQTDGVSEKANAKKRAIESVMTADLHAGNVEKMTEHLQALMNGMSPDEINEVKKLFTNPSPSLSGKTNKDDELADNWREGGYPYKNRMSRKNYEAQKYELQVELLKLQKWVKDTGQKIVIIFEGRDAAGKGVPSNALWSTLTHVAPKLWHLKNPPNKKQGNGIFSAISSTYPPKAKSYCLIVHGTTVLG